MKKLISSLVALVISLGSLFGLAVLSAPAAMAGDSPTVAICHATSSDTNPYESLTVNKNSVINEGHGSHDRDIIPPFEYAEKKGDPLITYPGKNWNDEGKAIYANSCVKPLTVVTPIAPTYTPGTCANPTGTVNLSDQPAGVRLSFGPKLSGEGLGAAWTVAYVAEDGYKLSSETAGIFTIPVVGPNSSDPNWDSETNSCGLPEVGAGTLTSYLPYAAGLLALGGILAFVGFRRKTA